MGMIACFIFLAEEGLLSHSPPVAFSGSAVPNLRLGGDGVIFHRFECVVESATSIHDCTSKLLSNGILIYNNDNHYQLMDLSFKRVGRISPATLPNVPKNLFNESGRACLHRTEAEITKDGGTDVSP